MTKSAPVNQPTWGRPQALAWNIGTIARMLSAWLMPSAPPDATPNACRKDDRWL